MKRDEDPPSPLTEPPEVRELRARVHALEQELRARDEFIIAAAHELRNPVSPLVLHVQRMLDQARGASSEQLSARWVGDQLEVFSQRLSRFIRALNRILDISRIHSGQIELVLEDVDLSEVVREVVSSFERELAASGSTLQLACDQRAVGHWDRMRLEQIVSNLVSNAIRYGDGSAITVAVALLDAQVELSVSDQGVGIDDADQARIFERFERATSQNRAGFGVGLWIVRELSEAMGGRVSVESGRGQGSTFRVSLPAKGTGK